MNEEMKELIKRIKKEMRVEKRRKWKEGRRG